MAGSDVSQSKDRPIIPWSDRYTLKLRGAGKVTIQRYVLYVVQIAVVIILEYLSVMLSYSGISIFFFA
ncbi:MAG: hypothetical protein JRN02_00875 [Nitrososphaerota archaeon]|nr:hypothetical protein [Nitrososphaerota archaeon]